MFLDELFLIFVRLISNLHAFFEEINKLHPTIKFTMTRTTSKSEWDLPPSCHCPNIEALPFLDTLCRVKEGKISTHLYRKPLDRY